MNKSKLILTPGQKQELIWFCKNVLGTRQEFYSVMDQANSFDEKLKRLEKTCAAIEKYFGEELKPHEPIDWENASPEPTTTEGEK